MKAWWFEIWLQREAALAGAVLLAFVLAAVASPPVITSPPASQTIFLGDPVTFRVGAGGTTPLSYQWWRNGTVITGATATVYTFTTAATDHNVQFSAQVTNLDGAAMSAPAVLTIDFGEPGPLQTNRFIEITNVWFYNVNQIDLGTAWTAPSYRDDAWATGGGLLCVEDSALPGAKDHDLTAHGGQPAHDLLFPNAFHKRGFQCLLPQPRGELGD